MRKRTQLPKRRKSENYHWQSDSGSLCTEAYVTLKACSLRHRVGGLRFDSNWRYAIAREFRVGEERVWWVASHEWGLWTECPRCGHSDGTWCSERKYNHRALLTGMEMKVAVDWMCRRWIFLSNRTLVQLSLGGGGAVSWWRQTCRQNNAFLLSRVSQCTQNKTHCWNMPLLLWHCSHTVRPFELCLVRTIFCKPMRQDSVQPDNRCRVSWQINLSR
jgi:hypothetical protein